MERTQQTSTNLLDTHDRLIAQVLEHFQKLTRLASIHGDGRPETGQPDTSAVNGLSMQIEFEGLNNSVKELLTLSRRLKELWVFGPPGKEDANAKAQAEQVENDVARVAELLNGVQAKRMRALAEEHGGRWKSDLKGQGDPTGQALAYDGIAAPP